MLIQIGAALSLTSKYLQLRGNVYQFRIRVPSHLVSRYGKEEIRKSLRTSDPMLALRLAEAEAQKYLSEFGRLSTHQPGVPKDVIKEARELANRFDFDTFIDSVAQPAREKFAQGDDWVYEDALPSDFLTPVQLGALDELRNPDRFRLSDALHLYLKTHPKGAELHFITKTSRDWNALLDLIGDIRFSELSRSHARDFVDSLTAKGLKTGTIRRTLNTLGAIAGAAITERELTRPNPFKSIKIQGEGSDTEKPETATSQQLHEIAQAFRDETSKAVSLMILLQMELGCRIGEVSGLAVEDVFLDAEVPHVYFQERPWRSLKNYGSTRRVPVVGIALEALRHAMELPRSGPGLFQSYAKDGATTMLQQQRISAFPVGD